MTSTEGETNQKQLIALVQEAVKRNGQSRRDRTLSGKGKRRNGTSKNKTQKRPGKRQRNDAKQKRIPSGKQPKKRSKSRKQD